MADFVRAADISELVDPGKMLVDVDGEMVALFLVDGTFYAIDDVCTHDGGPLVEGELNGYKIACPRHGARFDIRTGAALTMPAVRGTRAHDVKVENGGVWVRLGSLGATDGPMSHATSAANGFEATGRPLPASVLATTAAQQTALTAQETVAPSTTVASRTTAEIEVGSVSTAVLCEDSVRELLKKVIDPELFVNIVDLGLIYGVTLSPAVDLPGKQHVAIDMTMTSPACPAGPQLIADTRRSVGAHEDVSAVEVRIVMDPPWTPDRMTDAARDSLGIF